MTDRQASGDEQRPLTEEEMLKLSPEELQARYQQEMEQRLSKVRVEDVMVEALVTLINLAGRRSGMVPGAESERDLDQLRLAIDGARALQGLVADKLGSDANTIDRALSDLKMAYVRLTGDSAGSDAAATSGRSAGADGSTATDAGPAQSSGRLWVPGQ